MRIAAIVVMLTLLLTVSACAQTVPRGGPGGGLFFDTLPVTIEGRVMVPLRAVFEWLGARVEYDEGRIVAYDAGSHVPRVTLALGRTVAEISGKPYALDVPPVMVGERTFVPLRFVAEAFGVWVDAEGRVVKLQMPQFDLEAQMAVPPAPESHLYKIWVQIARWYELGGVEPMPTDKPLWGLYSERKKQALLTEMGSEAPAKVEAQMRARGQAQVRIIANEPEPNGGKVVVEVLAMWPDAKVMHEKFKMVLQRDGWRVDGHSFSPL